MEWNELVSFAKLGKLFLGCNTTMYWHESVVNLLTDNKKTNTTEYLVHHACMAANILSCKYLQYQRTNRITLLMSL